MNLNMTVGQAVC